MVPVERHGSGGRWEDTVGYSRVVRAGERVLVAGTTATTSDGAIAGLGDAYAQTRQIVENLQAALAKVGATLADVVRTRAYLVDAAHFEAFGRAHGEAFGDVRPVNTTVVVSALADPRMLVELEAEAHLPAAAEGA